MNKNIGKKNYDEKIPFATPTNGMTQFIQQALISFFVLVTVLENILRSIVLLPFLEVSERTGLPLTYISSHYIPFILLIKTK